MAQSPNLISVITEEAEQVAQTVKNLPAMQETPVQFLCQVDPLEIGNPLQYSWRLSWTEEPGGITESQT